MRRAVGIDDDRVRDVFDDAGTGERFFCPAREAADERGRDAIGRVRREAEGFVAEEPEGVLGAGLGADFALANPVGGGEDYKVLGAGGVLRRGVEIDPEEAAIGAEVEDATGDGEIAVVVGDDLAGDREEVVGGVGERLVARALDAPEGLRGGEVVVEEGQQARVLDEGVLAAIYGRWAVLPEPLDV